MTAKEYAGSYGYYRFDPRAVSADASKATIIMNLAFGEKERLFVKERFGSECPEKDEIIIELHKGGEFKVIKRSSGISQLLSHYSRALGSPSFFDFIGPYRQAQKSQLQTWDSSYLSDDRIKQTLAWISTEGDSPKDLAPQP
jgi:hypothetical protein